MSFKFSRTRLLVEVVALIPPNKKSKNDIDLLYYRKSQGPDVNFGAVNGIVPSTGTRLQKCSHLESKG